MLALPLDSSRPFAVAVLAAHQSADERLFELAGEDIHLWQFAIPLRHVQLRRAAESLPDVGERTRARAHTFADDRLRRLHCRGMLRILLGRYLARSPQCLRFVDNEFGKPALAESDGLHFNLSHARDLAVIGLTRGGPIGVDVERIRPLVNRDALVGDYFSESERDWLNGRPLQRRDRDFLRLWTGKEAVLKALGTGLAIQAKDVSVCSSDGRTEFGGITRADSANPSPWTLFSASREANHAIAVAIRACIDPGRIRRFHVAEDFSERPRISMSSLATGNAKPIGL